MSSIRTTQTGRPKRGCRLPDPNNVVLHELGICLALPCKAANTSIKLGLAHHLGLELPKPTEPPQFGVHNAEGLFEYTALEDVPKSYTVIGVMREPLSRIISSWQFTAAPHQDFPAWVRRMAQHSDHDADQHVRSQSYDLMVSGCWRPNYMLYVEHLDEDWRALERHVARDGCGGASWCEPFPLPNTNTLEENGCERRVPTFTAETWKIIYSRWAADFLAYDLLEPRRILHKAEMFQAWHARELRKAAATASGG